MTRRQILPLIFWLCLLPVSCFANDGFGGLTATGLQFGHTDAVRMVREDLFLSADKVVVRYLFHNDATSGLKGEVIFPLPPISLNELYSSGFSLNQSSLHSSNPVDFTVRVNGMPIPVRTERRAILEPPYDKRQKGGDRYDTPGEDVTAVLNELGIPLSPDPQEITPILAKLSLPQKQRLQRLGLVEMYSGNPPLALWSIVLNYHWTQWFPPGKDMQIEHSYNPAPPGGIFVWPAKESDLAPYQQKQIEQYCIDPPTRRGIVKRLYSSQNSGSLGNGMAIYLDYILTTANTWHGPIGTFHLTIDKGSPDNILSLCLNGIKKTGPTRFELTRTHFRPQRDLHLLFVAPLAAY
ncbi:DUF4424 family protein [Desulfobulbus rhabdoformis]|uniref:DUF4424 family protein n=1 Tax=Desulfobulbus rhabdoformis TaxID=34032 RepID=UPI0019625F6A|nr:DUF4424 family protein [Desulfobulbus rhabdoformis]MBM9613712.1 DUF4424 family protein [Desulfobulbus rhabdoformis]